MDEKELNELRDIKRLLVLLLLKNEATTTEIGRALGIDRSRVSHMLNPKGERDGRKKEQDA